MAAQELRWLTYLLTDLGEQPCSSPVLYVDNKAMIVLCQEHRLEHRTKHIALRYFPARELQGQPMLQLVLVGADYAAASSAAGQPMPLLVLVAVKAAAGSRGSRVVGSGCGRLWAVLYGFGRFRTVMDSSGRFWPVMGCPGRSWAVLGGFGWRVQGGAVGPRWGGIGGAVGTFLVAAGTAGAFLAVSSAARATGFRWGGGHKVRGGDGMGTGRDGDANPRVTGAQREGGRGRDEEGTGGDGGATGTGREVTGMRREEDGRRQGHNEEDDGGVTERTTGTRRGGEGG
ncbi:unnamed protein product [Closterium sp. NIES-54]